MLRIVAALLAGLLLCAQTPMLPGFPPGTFQNRAALDATVASGCADSNVIAWKAAVITAGGTVGTGQETNVCTLVTALKAHSLFTIQDRIWLHASENVQQANIDIVNLGVATPVSAPSFAANQGYTFSSNYLDTGFSPSVHGVNFTRNSASTSTYIRTSRTSGNNGVAVGLFDAASTGNQSVLLPLSGIDLITYDVNNAQFDAQVSQSPAQAAGLYTAVRTGASAQAVYKNSNSTAVGTNTTASITLPNLNFFIGARNHDGSPDLGSTDQIAITTLGAGMNGANTAQFQTDLNAYMTALGTNVY